MKKFSSSFRYLLLPLYVSIASIGIAVADESPPVPVSLTVICQEEISTCKLLSDIARNKFSHSSRIILTDKMPAFQVFLYANRAVNDKKNSDSWSIAIVHTSRVEIDQLAHSILKNKDSVSKEVAADAFLIFSQTGGQLTHINVASLSDGSAAQITELVDSVLANFLTKIAN